MKIAVRLDDITPDMDWKRFLAFKALLDQYQVKPLIGIVPDNQDSMLNGDSKINQAVGAPDDFWEYIKNLEAEGYVLAMHGYRHEYTTQKGGLFPLNHFSEFAGISYKKQKEMIQKGKELLEAHGIHTEIFMAPAHSYDRNTLKALKDNGFVALTDGFGKKPYLWKKLTFYPISFKLSQSLKKKEGFSTLVVHTGTIREEELQNYEAYFQNPNVDWINYSEFMKESPVKKSMLHVCMEYLMAYGKSLVGRLLSMRKK